MLSANESSEGTGARSGLDKKVALLEWMSENEAVVEVGASMSAHTAASLASTSLWVTCHITLPVWFHL